MSVTYKIVAILLIQKCVIVLIKSFWKLNQFLEISISVAGLMWYEFSNEFQFM